jgi:hypothetical protein
MYVVRLRSIDDILDYKAFTSRSENSLLLIMDPCSSQYFPC